MSDVHCDYNTSGVWIYLVCKGLWWIIDDDGLWQISAQNVEVLDVVSLDTHTMLSKQPVSMVTQEREERSISDKVRAINNSEEPQHWQPYSNVCHDSCCSQRSELRHCSFRLTFTSEIVLLSENQTASYLTSCFLGSKMLSSLSAYTFLDAVKRMICKENKSITFGIQMQDTESKFTSVDKLNLPHRFETCVPEILWRTASGEHTPAHDSTWQ